MSATVPSAGELERIRAAAGDLRDFVRGLGAADFAALPAKDRRTCRAVRQVLCEIGEAVGRLPPEIPSAHPDVDWRGYAALAEIAGSPGFDAAMPRLWPMITQGLPALDAAVDAEFRRQTAPAVPRRPPEGPSAVAYPTATAWKRFLAGLRKANAVAGSDIERADLQALAQALMALHALLGNQPDVVAEGLHQPFRHLAVAVGDLAQGRSPGLLQPLPRGSRSKGIAEQTTMAIAALALDEIVKGLGTPLEQAAEKVARAIAAAGLPVKPRGDATMASTVRGWRERLMEGEGAAPALALHVWQEYHRDPCRRGPTPSARVAWLMRRLRRNPRLIRWR